MSDALLVGILGVGLLVLAVIVELRSRQRVPATSGLSRATLVVGALGVLDLVVAALLTQI